MRTRQSGDPAKNVYTIDAKRGTLSLYKVNKNACMIAGSYHYSTGMNGSTDYTAGGTGPLPPGNYSLHPYEISPAGLFRKFIDPRDWGDFRVPLHPDPGTNTYGRSGFFLHGGHIRNASEGCLKVQGANQNTLFQQLQGAADPVPVTVTVP